MQTNRRDFLKGVLAGVFGAFLTRAGVVKAKPKEDDGWHHFPMYWKDPEPQAVELRIDEDETGQDGWWMQDYIQGWRLDILTDEEKRCAFLEKVCASMVPRPEPYRSTDLAEDEDDWFCDYDWMTWQSTYDEDDEDLYCGTELTDDEFFAGDIRAGAVWDCALSIEQMTAINEALLADKPYWFHPTPDCPWPTRASQNIDGKMVQVWPDSKGWTHWMIDREGLAWVSRDDGLTFERYETMVWASFDQGETWETMPLQEFLDESA